MMPYMLDKDQVRIIQVALVERESKCLSEIQRYKASANSGKVIHWEEELARVQKIWRVFK